jgi:hypothetical protein
MGRRMSDACARNIKGKRREVCGKRRDESSSPKRSAILDVSWWIFLKPFHEIPDHNPQDV